MIAGYRYIRKKRYEKRGNIPKTTETVPCRHQSGSSSTPCPECNAEKSFARRYRWKIIFGLVFPYALQALDSTIIASALTWIARDFGQVAQQNWIVASFNLPSAAFIPFWAQMADIFGRNITLNAAIIFMLIGSALCTGAPTNAFPVLLLGRGFQGVAAAGLNVIVRTILADRVSLAENAKNWSIFALVGGVAYALGPVIGGYFAGSDWRWCFAINLPVGAVAIIITFVLLRKELLGPQQLPGLDVTTSNGRRAKLAARLSIIDVGGQLLFLFGFGLIVLALTWAGATYSWTSAAVLVPLVVGLVLTGCFFYWEYLMTPEKTLGRRWPHRGAMIPWPILSNRDISLLFFSEACSGMAMYAVLYFCSIYFNIVQGYKADKAGVQLLYFTPGIAGGVIFSSYLCNSLPRMTWPPIFLGTFIEAIGVGLMAWAMYTERSANVFGMLALTGFGVGLRFMAAPLHAVGLFRNHRAAVIGLLAVSVPLGGTLGLTIMSTVFNNTSGLDSTDSDFSRIGDLPQDLRDEAINKAKMGIVWSFVAVTPFLVASFLCSLFLGNIKLGRGSGPDEDGSQNDVIRDIYLVTLIRGRRAANGAEQGSRLSDSCERDDATSHEGPIPMVQRRSLV